MTEEMTETLRKKWNQRTLKSFWEIEAREEIRIGEGGYVMVTNADGYIVRYAYSMREIIDYLKATGYDESYDIYVHIDGILLNHCSSFAIWTIVDVFEN